MSDRLKSRPFNEVCEEAILGALPVVTDAIDDPTRTAKERAHLRVVHTKMRMVLEVLATSPHGERGKGEGE